MWRVLALLLACGLLLWFLKSRHELEVERAKLEVERAKLALQVAAATTDREPEAPAAVPNDAELKAAVDQVFGDLRQPAPAPEEHPGLPVVRSPEVRANALVVWQVTEKNQFWHRVSYSFELWSMVPQTLVVDLEANILNNNGLPLAQKSHSNLVLPADGRRIKLVDFYLVSCPACYQVAKVEGAMNIRAAN